MIRPITLRDDLTHIASLIYATDPFLFPYIFGKSPLGEPRIEALIALEANSFSYRMIRGYFDSEGVCQGVYIAYNKKNKSNDRDFSAVFKGLRGLWLALKLLPIAHLLNPPITNTYYLQNISVNESSRGQGIGRALLADFYDQAKKKGHASVSLDVSLDNPGALRLYVSEGFQRIKKRKILGLYPVLYYCEKRLDTTTP